MNEHGSSTLSDENADSNNWKWSDGSKAIWDPAGENWQDFNAKWHGATESQSFLDPKSPSLSLEPLPRLNPFISSSILVRESYVTMFETVWEQAILLGVRNGVIITGQPGTGKTLFNYYLLIRLLQRKQVVLFSPDGETVYLFYQNEVYATSFKAAGEKTLPYPKSPSNVFIWSLFDISESKQPRELLIAPPCFPVQTTEPDPIRYKKWDKEYAPLITGLPLWNHDELAQGLQYQEQYHSLLNALHKFYENPSANSSDPLEPYPGTRELLEERYSEEDTVQPSPKDALNYLLNAAIDHFGYSARDVFSAVFRYQMVTQLHEKAFDVKYPELQDAVSALSRLRTANYTISHQILALRPVGSLANVHWDVDFKSDWIARSVIRELGEQADIKIREQIQFFLNIPGARGFAGRLLEPLAHRYIASATDDICWPLINMDSNDTDSPKFTLVQDPSVLINVRFPKTERKVVKFQSITDLSTVEHDSYYIPVDANFPLFDAFTIELDLGKNSAILWVLQMTTSRMHEGSSRGYQKIRQIIAILKETLRKKLEREERPAKKRKTATGQATPEVFIQVCYLLVVPKDESQSRDLQWQFPKGWNQNRKKHDHHGKVYCLEVPLTVLVPDIKTTVSL